MMAKRLKHKPGHIMRCRKTRVIWAPRRNPVPPAHLQLTRERTATLSSRSRESPGPTELLQPTLKRRVITPIRRSTMQNAMTLSTYIRRSYAMFALCTFLAPICPKGAEVLELKKTGDAVSEWRDGKNAREYDSAYVSGIILGAGVSQSKPVYRFFIPPPTVLAGSVELERFEILVSGAGERADMYVGDLLVARSFSPGQVYPVSVPALRPYVHQLGSRYYVDVVLDVDWSARLDVKQVTVRVSYPGPRQTVGHYLMCLGAASAIEEFRTRIAVPTLDYYYPPGESVAQQAMEAIRSTILGTWTDVLPYSDLLLLWDVAEMKQQLNLVGALADEAEFNGAFGPGGYALPRVGASCGLAVSKLEEVAAIWYQSLQNQGLPNPSSYNALVDATDVALGALQHVLTLWGDRLTLYAYIHQNNQASQGVVNLAELTRLSIAPILLVERINGSTVVRSSSLLPATRSNLAATRLQTPTGTLKVTISPVGAATAGAQWRLDEGAWQNSGSGVSGLLPGDYRISFKPISGWAEPSPQYVTFTGTGDDRIDVSASYIEIPKTLTISPSTRNHGSTGATGQTLTVTANVPWTATATESWITVTSGQSAPGNGTVSYSVGPNIGLLRSGTITVSGGGMNAIFTLNQAAPGSLGITPSRRSHGSDAVDGQIITVTGDVSWVAAADQPWIMIVSGQVGSGDGTVTYALEANDGPARSGAITVSGQGINWVFTVSQTAASEPAPHGLVALYQLDGTAEDGSGNGSHGELTDVVWADDRNGVAGQACGFNGVASVITVPHSASLDVHGTQSLTVAAWIKAQAPHNGETIVAKWGMDFREDDQFMLHLTEEGYPTFMVSDGSHEELVVSAVAVRAGVWHQVSGVFDYGAQRMQIYLDGQLMGDKAVTVSIQSVPVQLRIGQFGAPDNAFEGLIDEVRIYDRALTTQEIRNLVQPERGPIAHWEMQQSTPGFVVDVSGNGHSAQVFGDPIFGFASEIGHPFVRFQGPSTYLQVPHDDELNLPGDWTFAFWVLQEQSHPNQIVINKVRAYHDIEAGYRLWLGEAPDYVVAVSKYIQSGGNPWVKGGYLPPPLWHHVAVTHDSATDKTTFYVDGYASSEDVLASFGTGNAYDLLIGATKEEDETTINPHTAAYFGLADLRMYDRALAPDEVVQLLDRNRAYYGFGKDQGASVKDSAPGGLWDGLLVGGASHSDQTLLGSGSCLSLDGVSGFASLPASVTAEWPVGGVEAWIYIESYPHGLAPILSQGTTACTLFLLTINHDGSTTAHMCGTQTGSRYFTADSRVPLRQWTKVGFSWDGDSWKLFMNGTIVGETPATQQPAASTTVPLCIGRHNHSDGPFFFHGRIDDVRLTSGLVDDAHGQTSLVARWDMVPEDGVVHDRSVRGHNATVHGTPEFGYAPEIGHSYVRFNGHSYLTVQDADDLDLTEHWTIALWVNHREWFSNQIYLNKIRAYGDWDGEGGYRLDLAEPSHGLNVIRFASEPGIPGKNRGVSGGTRGLGWHHVAARYQADVERVDLFIDGRLVGQGTWPPMKANNQVLFIGASSEVDGTTINPHTMARFDVADLRIYSSCLSAAQISGLARPAAGRLVLDLAGDRASLTIDGPWGARLRLETSTDVAGVAGWQLLREIDITKSNMIIEEPMAHGKASAFFRLIRVSK